MTSNKEAITDPNLVYRSMDTCPTGPKVLLLNRAGIAQAGWYDGRYDAIKDWYVGWYPLPKIPDEIMTLVEPSYKVKT